MFDGMPGGFPGGVPQNPEQMQQSMQQMMNNPVVQSLLDNPEFLHTMMQSNPAIRQVCCESVEWEGNWGGGYSLCLSMLLAPVVRELVHRISTCGICTTWLQCDDDCLLTAYTDDGPAPRAGPDDEQPADAARGDARGGQSGMRRTWLCPCANRLPLLATGF